MRDHERPDPVSSPPPIDDYRATIVTIDDGRGHLQLTPTTGIVSATPRDHLEAAVVHVVTAANPWSVALDEAENAARNDEAEALLAARGVRHHRAVGRDRAGTWAEPGFALLDADEADVLRWARAWSQHGIYRWDATGWWLVLTDGSAPTAPAGRVQRLAPDSPPRA